MVYAVQHQEESVQSWRHFCKSAEENTHAFSFLSYHCAYPEVDLIKKYKLETWNRHSKRQAVTDMMLADGDQIPQADFQAIWYIA